MPSTPWFTRALALLVAAAAGCSVASPPPDEAKARLFGSRAVPPEELLEAARQHYQPAAADYFHDMDTQSRDDAQTAGPPPLNPEEVKGRNAWMLWCGGNEAFWDWLAQHSYGAIDLLKLVDSRERGKRFGRRGAVTEPGCRPPTDEETREAHGVRYDRRIKPGEATPGGPHVDYVRTPADPMREPPDPAVYGYSTGVVGLRLFPNPAFVGTAKARWNPDLYYQDTAEGRAYAARPDLVRPFRVGMSCAFCHAAPHPLRPPPSPEFPEWTHLSANIGNQYMRFRTIFGNTLKQDNFLYYVLDAQHPGTIDTSLVAADNINNPNTVNAFFGLPGRVQRAKGNPKEAIGEPTVDFLHQFAPKGEDANPAFVPRVLLDGSDSVGVRIALARVYLNIGTYHQQWVRTHNPLLGFRKQDPFTLKDCADNSVYWHATWIRVQPMIDYFLATTNPQRLRDASPLPPVKPGDPPLWKGEGRPWNPEYAAGRAVFSRGCIACHSSVQPGDMPKLEGKITDALAKQAKESEEKAKAAGQPPPPTVPPLPPDRTTLRLRTDDLARLARGSGKLPPEYERWAQEAVKLEDFWRWTETDPATPPADPPKYVHNYLSTDVRIPVTLVRTNAARAMATNSITGNVWEDFASDTYKHLDTVGRVTYRDPFSGAERSFEAPVGGPGYYRPPSLISAWATAPFLHNNALGTFNNDPTVAGRLEAFHDAIDRLLLRKDRLTSFKTVVWPVDQEGPTRVDNAPAEQLAKDGGWVFRTPTETWVTFEGPHVPVFVAGLTGLSPFWQAVLPWGPTILFVVLGVIILFSDRIFRFLQRLEARVSLLGWAFRPVRWAVAFGAFVLAGLTGHLIWWKFWYLIELLGVALDTSVYWLGLQASSVPIFFLAVGVLFILAQFRTLAARRRTAQRFGVLCLVWAVVLALGFGRFLSGRGGDVKFGPIPAGVPVNVLANMHPQPPLEAGIAARKALIDFVLDYHRAGDGNKPGLKEFESRVAPALLNASKCPDFVTDRGHDFEFIRQMSDADKLELIALLKTF